MLKQNRRKLEFASVRSDSFLLASCLFKSFTGLQIGDDEGLPGTACVRRFDLQIKNFMLG
jgi:hypothetical protein